MALEPQEGELWWESRFEDGWLLASGVDGFTGARHFVVLDDGHVHYELGSLPPRWYVAKFSRAGSDVSLDLVNERLSRSQMDDDSLPG